MFPKSGDNRNILTVEGDDPIFPESGEAQNVFEVGEPPMEQMDLLRGTVTGDARKQHSRTLVLSLLTFVGRPRNTKLDKQRNP